MTEAGIEIKVARIRRGLKQSEVAEATGVPQCVISRIENGQAEKNKEAAERLQRYLTELS